MVWLVSGRQNRGTPTPPHPVALVASAQKSRSGCANEILQSHVSGEILSWLLLLGAQKLLRTCSTRKRGITLYGLSTFRGWVRIACVRVASGFLPLVSRCGVVVSRWARPDRRSFIFVTPRQRRHGTAQAWSEVYIWTHWRGGENRVLPSFRYPSSLSKHLYRRSR